MRIRQKTKSEVVTPNAVTVHRDKWLQGSSRKESYMLDKQDNMCCLGFVAHAAGVGSEHMCRSNTPASVIHQAGAREFPFHNIPVLTTLQGMNSKFSGTAMEINDRSAITLAEREDQLTKHFSKAGITLKFRGKYGEDSLSHDKRVIREREQDDEKDGAASSSE